MPHDGLAVLACDHKADGGHAIAVGNPVVPDDAHTRFIAKIGEQLLREQVFMSGKCIERALHALPPGTHCSQLGTNFMQIIGNACTAPRQLEIHIAWLQLVRQHLGADEMVIQAW